MSEPAPLADFAREYLGYVPPGEETVIDRLRWFLIRRRLGFRKQIRQAMQRHPAGKGLR